MLIIFRVEYLCHMVTTSVYHLNTSCMQVLVAFKHTVK